MQEAVLIDGRAVPGDEAAVPVRDWVVLRGDGCFEAIRSYGGRLFRLDDHLDRLERSATALDLPLPARHELVAWSEEAARQGGDCSIRVVVTRGSGHPGVDLPGRVVVLAEPLPNLPEAYRLVPLPAPWHPGGDPWELSGVKSTSYAPNMAAQRRAQAAGFDDALLVSREGWILELPTSSVGWFHEGSVQTPALDLGILDSITRRVVLDEASRAGLEVREGRFSIEALLSADEAFVMSTLKEVRPVRAVGERAFPPGRQVIEVRDLFRSRVGAEVG